MNQLTSTEINIALLTLGGLVLALGLLSGFLKQRLFLSDPIVALLVGILLSPAVSGLINLNHWGTPDTILEQGARIAISIQLMGVALRLPNHYLGRHKRVVTILLGCVLPLMWVLSGLLVYWILDFPFWVALLTGAILTPTDPVVATSIVTGRVAHHNLPPRIRHALSAESAINDGLGYPFVFLGILMLQKPPVEAVGEWVAKTLLWEVGGSVILGMVLGYFAGRLLERAEQKQLLEKPSFLAYTVALSLTVLASVKLLGCDGILAVFVAGVVFSLTVRTSDRAEEENVQEAVDRFFTLYIFVILGLALPWEQWSALGWQGFGLAIALILFRRLPALLVFKGLFPSDYSLKDLVFMGWFGPIGVAAIFYGMLSLREVGEERIWVITSLVICVSILIHGLSAVPFSKLYGQSTRPQQLPPL